MSKFLPIESIAHAIFLIRNAKVMLDVDLANLYGVPTKRLNEQVKRNIERFPDDFMFELTKAEKDELVANCDQFENLKHSSALPRAFTEHGAIMLANVLKNPKAVQTSIQVVRAFVQLREMIASHKHLALKLAQLEKKYDSQFKSVFDAIRQLMVPPIQTKKRIGFLT